MARRVLRWEFEGGGAAVSTSSVWYSPWKQTVTAAAGTPTCVFGVDAGTTGGNGHVARLGFTSNNQVENICLSFGDVLQFDIDDKLVLRGRSRMGQSALDTATSCVWGLAGDRNDTLDSVAQHMWFRMEGGTSTTAVYFEADDGTTDSDDNATGMTLTTGWKEWMIDAKTKSAVRYHFTDSNGVLIPLATTMNMSAYSGGLQILFQHQKTADTNTDYIEHDYVELSWEVNS